MAQNIRDRNSELRLELQALAFLDEYRKRQAMLDTDMLSIGREISPSLPYMSYNDIKDKYKRLEEILHNASNKLIEDFVINKLIEDFIDVSPDKLFHPSEKEFIGPLLLLSNTTKCINLVQYHHLYSGYISEEDKKTIELFEGLNRGTYLKTSAQ